MSSVLGTILMLSLMATMVPGAILMKQAVNDEFAAQREGAQGAAWCVRHPEIHQPTCPASGPMPSYDCREVQLDAWVCSDDEGRLDELEQQLERTNETLTNSTTGPPTASTATTGPKLR